MKCNKCFATLDRDKIEDEPWCPDCFKKIDSLNLSESSEKEEVKFKLIDRVSYNALLQKEGRKQVEITAANRESLENKVNTWLLDSWNVNSIFMQKTSTIKLL